MGVLEEGLVQTHAKVPLPAHQQYGEYAHVELADLTWAEEVSEVMVCCHGNNFDGVLTSAGLCIQDEEQGGHNKLKHPGALEHMAQKFLGERDQKRLRRPHTTFTDHTKA